MKNTGAVFFCLFFLFYSPGLCLKQMNHSGRTNKKEKQEAQAAVALVATQLRKMAVPDNET